MTDYRNILKQHFAERCRANSRYSLRAFARDLGISPSVLSEVLNRKHGLSEKRARQIADKIGLSREEKETFIRAVLASDSRSRTTREMARESLESADASTQAIHRLSLDAFRVVADWHHFAIIEYLQLKRKSHDPFDIGAALGISTHLVKEALERLQNLEMIEKRATTYKVVQPFYVSPEGIPSEAIRIFHRQILEKAIQAVTLQSLDQREFRNLVVAIDHRRLPELKAKIQEFTRSVNTESMAHTEKTTVYNLSIQLFELTPGLPSKGAKS